MKISKSIVSLIICFLLLSSGCSNLSNYAGKRSGKPQIAFIIDDVGYHQSYKNLVLAIDAPMTYAVIPHTDSAKLMAKFLYQNNREVILHLPLAAVNSAANKEKGMIYANMSEQEILNNLKMDIAAVPYIKGVNNHKGSRVTSDRRTMRIILKELKKRKLFFVDSVTSGKSVCLDVADELNMRIGSRDVFLDNEKESSYIQHQIAQLKQIALKHKRAIGIGHYHKTTLMTIAKSINVLKAAGIEIVFASEII